MCGDHKTSTQNNNHSQTQKSGNVRIHAEKILFFLNVGLHFNHTAEKKNFAELNGLHAQAAHVDLSTLKMF